MSTKDDLALINRASRELAEAKDIFEVSEVRGKAKALADYLSRKKGAEAAAAAANEIRLRAERRIGELSREIPKAPAGWAARKSSHDGVKREGKTEVLADAGLSILDASRYGALADIPANEFEKAVKAPGASTRSLVREGRKRSPSQRKPRPKPEGDPRAEWASAVARQATIESKRVPKCPMNQSIRKLGEQAKVLASMLRDQWRKKV